MAVSPLDAWGLIFRVDIYYFSNHFCEYVGEFRGLSLFSDWYSEKILESGINW